MILEREAPAGDGPDADGAEPKPSRSARKRNAEAMQKLGERLIALKPLQLQRFGLPPNCRTPCSRRSGCAAARRSRASASTSAG